MHTACRSGSGSLFPDELQVLLGLSTPGGAPDQLSRISSWFSSIPFENGLSQGCQTQIQTTAPYGLDPNLDLAAMTG